MNNGSPTLRVRGAVPAGTRSIFPIYPALPCRAFRFRACGTGVVADGRRRHRRRIASQALRNHHPAAKRPTDRISGAPERSPSREAAELESPARECRVAFPSHARVPTGTAPVRASFLLRTSWALTAQPPRVRLTTYIQTGVPRVWPVLPVWRGRPRPRRIEGIAPAMSSRSLL
jgi:hypothetical protein